MIQNEMIERYIYAVIKRLPFQMRGEIEDELRGMISDILEERGAVEQPGREEILAVLTELGKPEELARRYEPDSTRSLISPEYYSRYKTALKYALFIVLLGITIAVLINIVVYESPALLVMLGGWIGFMLLGSLCTFAVVTLIFAGLERYKEKKKWDENIYHLPPVPKKKGKIALWHPIVVMVLCVLFALAFSAFADLIGARNLHGGFTTAFNVPVLQEKSTLLFFIAALGIAREGFKIWEGRYTMRLTIVTGVVDLLSAIAAVIIFADANVIHPALRNERLTELFGGKPDFANTVMPHIAQIVLGIILLFLIIDFIYTFWKAQRSYG